MENIENQNTNNEISVENNNSKMDTILVLFKTSFEYYKSTIGKLILLYVLPVFLVFISFSLFGIVIKYIGQNSLKILLVSIITLLMIVFSIWAKASILYLVSNGGNHKLKDVFLNSKKYIWYYFVINTLIFFLVFGGSIFLLIPGFIFGIYSIFSLLVLINEDKKDLEAISQSFSYVHGFGWKIFTRLFLLFVIYLLVSLIPIIGSIVNVFFVLPFSVILIYKMYMNLKTISREDIVKNTTKTKNIIMIFVVLGLFLILSLITFMGFFL